MDSESLSAVWYVYIVNCADQTLYTGVTTNIRRRLRQHNGETQGGAKYTKCRRPIKLVWWREAVDRSSAQKLEVKIRRMSRSKKFLLIAGINSWP